MSEDQPSLLTYADLALRWRCCERTAMRLCSRWKIPKLSMGHRTVRFRPADILRHEQRQAERSLPKLPYGSRS